MNEFLKMISNEHISRNHFQTLYTGSFLTFRSLSIFKCWFNGEIVTLNMRGPSYLGLKWLSGHQQPRYWICKIGKSWSYTRKNFNYPWYVSEEKWHKYKYMCMFPLQILARKELNTSKWDVTAVMSMHPSNCKGIENLTARSSLEYRAEKSRSQNIATS